MGRGVVCGVVGWGGVGCMRRSPPASSYLTSMGSQKRPREESTSDYTPRKAASQHVRAVEVTPTLDEFECKNHKSSVRPKE
jgi:hypothetical protein